MFPAVCAPPTSRRLAGGGGGPVAGKSSGAGQVRKVRRPARLHRRPGYPAVATDLPSPLAAAATFGGAGPWTATFAAFISGVGRPPTPERRRRAEPGGR